MIWLLLWACGAGAPCTPSVWYEDLDGDGFGGLSVGACARPVGHVEVGGDCDDRNSGIHPGAVDLCDGIDADCDGTPDEGPTWYRDADGDGFGSALSVEACDRPSGFVDQSGDCDDGRADVFPGAAESCDGTDQDCDGQVDDGARDRAELHADADGDGFGAGPASLRCPASGWIVDGSDCDDSDPAVYPGAVERCDGVDQDCDLAVDEDAIDAGVWFADADGDGHGAGAPIVGCDGTGLAYADRDCDDQDADVFPGAPERCDGVDEDCDGVVDDDPVDGVAFYLDADLDGFGGAAIVACAQPSPAYTTIGGDCDDTNPSVRPGGTERVGDGVDGNCDGLELCFLDADGDGWGAEVIEVTACEGIAVPRVGDCDDLDAAVSPDAIEWRGNGVDDDCDPSTPDEAVHFVAETVLEDDGQGAQTANVRRVDLGLGEGVELLVAEPLRGWLTLVSACAGPCETFDIAVSDGTVPVRTAVADLDEDGALDVIVSDIGVLWPTTDLVGRVLLLRGDGGGGFTEEVLVAGLGRTACAEPGDLDGDGDLDLTVCEFGHIDGSVGWLEQRPGGWTHHVVDPRPGVIHLFPFDADADGDLDLGGVIAQDVEEVVLYRNDGVGGFGLEILAAGAEPYWGASSLEPVDLDQDGDVDLLFTNGDTMDFELPADLDPDAVYGVAWLENDGAGRFAEHEIGRVWGAYASKAVDLDLDGDLDVVVATDQLEDLWPDAPLRPMVWFERGPSGFLPARTLSMAPPHLLTLEAADVDEDGDPDLITGSMDVTSGGGARLVLLRSQLLGP